jgi:AraC-like DNA-binding protein
LHSSFRDPDLSISRLAEVCSVSEVYFRRIYGERFGISPLKALLNLRFDYAKRLLRSGYYTISQTAELSGFTDVKYFRTAFKARYGITPTQYYKKHKSL